MTVKHFEILRLKLKQYFKRKGNIYFRKLPYLFTSKKPAEVRMGKGKGGHFEWICPILIGQIFVEFSLKKNRNNSLFKLLKTIRKCKKRIPFKCKLITIRKKNYSNNMEKKYKILIK
ncbi:MAG: ribosomal protein L16 [bacterium]